MSHWLLSLAELGSSRFSERLMKTLHLWPLHVYPHVHKYTHEHTRTQTHTYMNTHTEEDWKKIHQYVPNRNALEFSDMAIYFS